MPGALEPSFIWPMHEGWAEMGTAPMKGENTIHQNQAPAFFTYGFLWSLTGNGDALPAFVKNSSEKLSSKMTPSKKSIHLVFENGTMSVKHFDKSNVVVISNLNGNN